MSGLTFRMARLDDLGGVDVHAMLALRAVVFVLEQRCPFLDPDELDLCSFHLLGRAADGQLAAYLRIVDPGRKALEPVIGRVVTQPERRGQGLGIALMQEGIRRCQGLWPGQGIRIGAQHRLLHFYENFGFASVGSVYIEDDIPHIEMLLPATAAAEEASPLSMERSI
jgi:ElaA protein